MSNSPIETGRAALAAALARAGKRASTAAVLAAVVPLTMMASAPPAAALLFIPDVTATGSNVSPGSGGVFDYNYDFQTITSSAEVIRIEIPEVQAGEFLSGSGGFFGSLHGWTVSQSLTSAFGPNAATFEFPNAAETPGAYIELVNGGEGSFLGEGTSLSFTLESDIGANTAAFAEVLLAGELDQSVDPPTPAPAVPEPGSLALFGTALVGLVGLARRKKT